MRNWMSLRWLRMLPPPISLPFSTVARLRPYFQWLRTQERNILIHRRGKGIVHEDVPLLFGRIIQQGKLDDPQRLPGSRIDQLQLFTQQQPDAAQHIVDNRSLVGAEQN